MGNAFDSQDKQVHEQAQQVSHTEEAVTDAVDAADVTEQAQSPEEDNNKHVEELTRTAADFMLLNIFRKHGVTKDKLNRITAEEKAELQQMIQNLQNQVKSVYTAPAVKQVAPAASETSGTKKRGVAKSKSRLRAKRGKNKPGSKRNLGR